MNKAAITMTSVAGTLAFLGVGYVISRHFEKITVDRLMAEVPADLREIDTPNPPAQDRYRHLVRLAEKVDPADVDNLGWFPKDAASRAKETLAANKYAPLFSQTEQILHSGSLQTSKEDKATSWKGFPELGKAISISISDSVHRRDASSAIKQCRLTMDLAHALLKAGGTVNDQTIGRIFELDGLTGINAADRASLLAPADRQYFLKQIPTNRGPDPELARAVGRTLCQVVIPNLVRQSAKGARRNGSLDKRDMFRLYVQVYGQAKEDSLSTARRSWENTAKLAEDIGNSAKTPAKNSAPLSPSKWAKSVLDSFDGDVAGRRGVSKTNLTWHLQKSRELATYQNMVREAILLRQSQTPALPDLLGFGNLQIDPRHRLIWSVGLDGIDDHGLAGRPGTRSGDLVLRY